MNANVDTWKTFEVIFDDFQWLEKVMFVWNSEKQFLSIHKAMLHVLQIMYKVCIK